MKKELTEKERSLLDYICSKYSLDFSGCKARKTKKGHLFVEGGSYVFRIEKKHLELILDSDYRTEDVMCFSEYFREVARTPDLKKMKKCLWMLANRYTEDVVYTVPLSLDTYTESAGVKHIGRRSYCAWGRKDDFTAAEKKALESVRNYVKKF